MPEPTSSGALAIAGTGLGALILAATGVEPQALFWGLIGSTLGVTLAPEAGRLRASLVFAAVVFASSLLGSWAAQQVDVGSHARNALTLIVAVLFHPLMSTAIAQVPAAMGWAGARLTAIFGGGRS